MFFTFLILFFFIFFCFWFPYKSGKKRVGLITSIILLLLAIFSFLPNADLIGVFIWMFIAAFSIVFITYWIFRFYKKKKIANVSAILLSLFFLYIALDPWITDWTFSKNDATEILKERGFVLNDKIKLLSNESGGFRDYYHTFSIAISDNDYKRISNQIISSHSFKGKKNRMISIQIIQDIKSMIQSLGKAMMLTSLI